MSEQPVEQEEKKSGTIEITDLGEAIKFVDDAAKEAVSYSQKFATNFKELTGYQPNQQMNALDVYKIALGVVAKEMEKTRD